MKIEGISISALWRTSCLMGILLAFLVVMTPLTLKGQATPATPATPAQPGGKGTPATPATPAIPATPPDPQKMSREQIKEAVQDAKEAAKEAGVTKEDVKEAAKEAGIKEKEMRDKKEELEKGKSGGEDSVPEINPASMGFALVLLLGGLLCLTDPRKLTRSS